MNNFKAVRMIEGRISDKVKTFNCYDVAEIDSDAHYFASQDMVKIAKAALGRAPEFKVTTLARSLGDIYRTIRKYATQDELKEWELCSSVIENLCDTYGI